VCLFTSQHGSLWGKTRGNAIPGVEKAAGTHAKGVTVVKVSKDALWMASQTISRPKMHSTVEFYKLYPGIIPQVPAEVLPVLGPRHFQTSARGADFSIFPVWQNAHCIPVTDGTKLHSSAAHIWMTCPGSGSNAKQLETELIITSPAATTTPLPRHTDAQIMRLFYVQFRTWMQTTHAGSPCDSRHERQRSA